MSTTTSVSHINKSLKALLTLALLACLSGCGPAPSGDASSIGTSMSGPDYGHEARGTGLEGGAAAVLVPTASDLPSRLSPLATSPIPAEQREAEPLVVPDWMAAALRDPDVQVRLKALDRWAQQGSNAPLDPLVVALDDQDEQVQAKALVLIARAWAREQKAKAEAEK